MDFKRSFILKRRRNGQAVIEYVLLLGALMAMAVAFVNTPLFQRLIGSDGGVYERLRKYMSFSYRHGHGEAIESEPDYTGNHEAYMNTGKGTTRFFVPAEKYPRN